MKTINPKFYLILILSLSIFVIKVISDLGLNDYTKKDEKVLIKGSIKVLNECFDLDNKNNRTLNESINLIDYCLKEYGHKK